MKAFIEKNVVDLDPSSGHVLIIILDPLQPPGPCQNVASININDLPITSTLRVSSSAESTEIAP
jgi:hypothetical protein